VNGAVRFTDYSTSGSVTTWKGGLIFQPVTDWRIRGTYSRDLRAPDIRELFSGNRLQFANVVDPFNGGTTTLTQVKVGGNSSLEAESSDTRSLGVVFQPEGALRGLTASIDYFDISLRDAITSLGAQSTVDGCYAGNAVLCSQITRNAGGTITSINATTINAARLETSGVDFVARYATTAWVPGKVDLSLTSTFVDKYLLSTDGVHTTNHAGEVGLNLLANGVEASTPHWIGTTGIGYSLGKMGFFAQVRYVGGGKYDNSYTSADIDPNEFSGRTYLDLSAHFDVEQNVQLYGGMNNVFDRAPPIIPGTFPGQPPTNTLLYDTMGRYLFVGVRASFK
jgi:outer membrane receptor protein involved in Fe transport